MSLEEKCYQLLKKIPPGRVTTYKILAQAMGTRAYRRVGTILSKNPDLIRVPCHRVIRSDGRVGEYALGAHKKISLLRQEGIVIHLETAKVQALEECLFRFDGK